MDLPDGEILKIGDPGYFVPWVARIDPTLEPDELARITCNENIAYPDRLAAYLGLQRIATFEIIRPAFLHLLCSDTAETRHFCYLCLSAKHNEFATDLFFGRPKFRKFAIARCRLETHPALRLHAFRARIGLRDDTVSAEIDREIEEITLRETSNYTRLQQQISQLKQSGDWEKVIRQE